MLNFFFFFFETVAVVELLEEAGVGCAWANGCYFNAGEVATRWESGWALVLGRGSPGTLGFAGGIHAWLPFPNPTVGHVFVQKEALL